jgi:diguanylate cyclase (GGDEF)-like protein
MKTKTVTLEQFAIVNLALENEMRQRQVLEDRLADVTAHVDADHYASLHDPLTGLANRALFADRLEHGLAQAHRHQRTLAVLFLDLDKFKLINDTWGHEVGDQVLCQVASRLDTATRTDDTVCRYGGDEFISVLTELESPSVVPAIIEKLQQAISLPIEIGQRTLSVRVSIGAAIFPRDGATATELIEQADRAMYAVKRG